MNSIISELLNELENVHNLWLQFKSNKFQKAFWTTLKWSPCLPIRKPCGLLIKCLENPTFKVNQEMCLLTNSSIITQFIPTTRKRLSCLIETTWCDGSDGAMQISRFRTARYTSRSGAPEFTTPYNRRLCYSQATGLAYIWATWLMTRDGNTSSVIDVFSWLWTLEGCN